MRLSRTPGLEALVIPRPQLPPNRSSLSSIASSPHTPRTPPCSSSFLFSPANRTSIDSWNSSNSHDEQEWDWKPEQVRLLSRTLDALPAHLVTPFNGPIPPSNLLDKIARGVSDAKGPIDWPHSLRATRVKLIELSRIRAKEKTQHLVDESYPGADEDDAVDGPMHTTHNYAIRRPLYRQSSMDFMNTADLKENDGIACLSERLQRTDRRTSNSAYHPYSRNLPRRLPSPGRPSNVPSLINPSTPSSSTLNTLSSFSAAARNRNSNLSLTSASSISMMSNNGDALPDPRVQRVKRSESFGAPIPPPRDIKPPSSPAVGMKRPPSFGTLAQEARRQRTPDASDGTKDLSYPSSDEEEKIRSKAAKKIKVKEGGRGDLVSADTPSSPSDALKKVRVKTRGTTTTPERKPKDDSPKSSKPKSRSGVCKDAPTDAASNPTRVKGAKKMRPGPMNLQRNPSMFGAELPHLRSDSQEAPLPPRSRIPTSPPAPPSPRHGKLSSGPITDPHLPNPANSPQKVKTLRRVRRLELGRRISFGSLANPAEDADAEGDDEDGDYHQRQRQRELGQLGSAFQLH